MPVSNNKEHAGALKNQLRPTLAELIAERAAVPPPPADGARASLAERFLLPPFSVLDARQGYWQNRKRAWIALGIQSELGRGEAYNNGLLGISEQARGHYKANATPCGHIMPATSLQGGRTIRGDG